MFCPHCGTKVTDDAAFCPSCGKPLKKENVQPEPQQKNLQKEEPKEEPIQNVTSPETTASVALPYEVKGPEKVQGKEQLKRMLKKLPMIGWIYIAIIALLLLGVLSTGITVSSLLGVALIAVVLYYIFLRQFWIAAGFGDAFSLQLPEGKADKDWSQQILDNFEYPVRMKKSEEKDGGVCLNFPDGAGVIFGKDYSVKVTVQNGELKTQAVTDGVMCDATTYLTACYAANEVAQALNYFANDAALPADFMLKQKELHKDTSGKIKKYAGTAALLIAGLALIIAFFSGRDASKGVKDSYIEQMSTTTTVGDALDSFYSKGKWSNYKEKGTQFVVYKGKQDQYGLDISLTFRLEDDAFAIEDSTINGEDEGLWGAALLLGAGYDDTTCKMVLAGTYSDEQTAEQEIYKILMEAATEEDVENQSNDDVLSQYLNNYSPDYSGDYSPDEMPADKYNSGDSTSSEAMTSDGGFVDGALDYNYNYEDGVIIPDVGDAGTYGVDITVDCVMKAGPGVNYDDVGTIYAGDTAVAIFTDGDWQLISDDSYTSFGWIPVAYQQPNRP